MIIAKIRNLVRYIFLRVTGFNTDNEWEKWAIIICILLLASASIIVLIKDTKIVLEFIVSIYTICFIPAIIYLTCNQGNIENYLFNTNTYYYIMFLLYCV